MKNITLIIATMILLVSVKATHAAIIDFSGYVTGYHSISSLTIDDMTFTSAGRDGFFGVVDGPTTAPYMASHSLTSYYNGYDPLYMENPFIGTFSIDTVTSVKIGAGDYGGDEDNIYLEAYDINDNLLDSDYLFLSTTQRAGWLYVESTSATISYIKFWDEEPFASAVWYDNVTYESNEQSPVPVPATITLFGIGLLGLAGVNRRKK